MINREYEYQLKSESVMIRAALFGAGAIGLAWLALTNDRGLILFIIPLTKNGATISYAIFASLAGLMSLVDVIKVVRRGSLQQRIALTEEGLIVPKTPTSNETKLIRYQDVTGLKEFTEPDHVMIIHHREGDFDLRLDMLTDERVYAEIVGAVAQRAQMSKPGMNAPAPTTPKPT